MYFIWSKQRSAFPLLLLHLGASIKEEEEEEEKVSE